MQRSTVIGLAALLLAFPLSILGLIVNVAPDSARPTVGLVIIANIIILLSAWLVNYLFQKPRNNAEKERIEKALTSIGYDEQANIMRDICQFDPGPIAIVASTVKTPPMSKYAKHFLYSTGSGQFYALSYLLPALAKAYPTREIRMLLCAHVTWEELVKYNVIILGGSPTNTHTKPFYKELKATYNVPFNYKSVHFWHQVQVFGEKHFKTKIHDGLGYDYGLIVRYTRPTPPHRKVLFLIGGSTSGTEAAAKFLTSHEDRIALRNRDNPVCIITTEVQHHRSTKLLEIGFSSDLVRRGP